MRRVSYSSGPAAVASRAALDTDALRTLAHAPLTERVLACMLDVSFQTAAASLTRLVVRRLVTTAPPVCPGGVIRWRCRDIRAQSTLRGT